MTNLSNLFDHFSSILWYLRRNGWTIVFMVAGTYYVYWNYIDPLLHKIQSERSFKEATNPDRVAVLKPDMRRVRAQQQQLAAKRALIAEEKRRENLKKEKQRKRVKTPTEERFEKRGGTGTRLDDNSGRNTTSMNEPAAM